MKNKLRQSIFASLTSVASIFFISCNISLNNSVPTPIQIEQKWGYINSTGQLVIPLRFDEACPFSEGLAKVSIGDKSGYINQSGKLVVPLQYDEALSFLQGYAPVRLDQKWGYINQRGKLLIDFNSMKHGGFLRI